MLNGLRYLFYKILIAIWAIRKSDTDEWTSLFFVTTIIWMNIQTLFSIAEYLAGHNILQLSSEIQVLLFFVPLLTANYLILIYDGRSKKILNTFKSESSENRTRGNLYIATYVAVSFILLFSITFMRIKTTRIP